MVYQLIRKDILLAKRYIPLISGLVIAIPLFIASSDPGLMSAGAFMLTTIYAEMILNQQIAMTELKYRKAEAFICATPYSRKNIIMAKYVFSLLVFAGCCLIYGILSLILPRMIEFSLGAVLTALLITMLIFGIFTPFQAKFGIEKMKFVFMIILMASAFAGPVIMNYLSGLDLTALSRISETTMLTLFAGAALIVWCGSLVISTRIYQKKDI